MRVAIIGGGAAGFFSAINVKRLAPQAEVTIYEAGAKTLVKVYLSGGGRCNLTNSFNGVKSLVKAYPRGEKLIKRAFKVFDYVDAYNWFEENGVSLVTQSDECVFPVSQRSNEIISTFERLAVALGIKVLVNCKIKKIEKLEQSFAGGNDKNSGRESNESERSSGRKSCNADGSINGSINSSINSSGGQDYNADGSSSSFVITTSSSKVGVVESDVVVVTTGGSPRAEGFEMLSKLPLEFVEPVPSLFSFNTPCAELNELMGAVMEEAIVSVVGTKFKGDGALLITHWGVSGPAVLKLSSYAARYLNEVGYKFNIAINWIGVTNEQDIIMELKGLIAENSKKNLGSLHPFGLSSRVWGHLLSRAKSLADKKCAEVGSKEINKLVTTLIYDVYEVHGRAKHKEEFVTCGGVALSSVNLNTLEAKECKGLFLAGEVLDVDAITGGFNLQAAWSTGYVVAKSVAESIVSSNY